MLRKFILIFCLFVFVIETKAQDPYYTQMFATTLQTNPALAGSKEVLRVSLDSRLQWRTALYGLSVNSFESDIALGRLGVGISAEYDRLKSIFSHTDVDLALSYRIGNLKKFIIQPGVSISYLHRSLDWDKLVFYDQLSPGGGLITDITDAIQPYENVNAFDVNAGLVTHFPIQLRRTEPMWFNLGVAMHHIPDIDLSHLGISENIYPHKYILHGGLLVPFYKKTETKHHDVTDFFLYPNFQYTALGNFSTVDLGVQMWRKPLFAGLTVRTFNEFYNFQNADQLCLLAGFESKWGEFVSYQITYSVDWAFTSVLEKNIPAFTTHELSVVVLFSPKRVRDCISELEYKGRHFDNNLKTKERHTNEYRWYDSEKLQRRFEGECPPAKGRRKVAQDVMPVFYPFELPVY